jgi:hypothetical protein
LRSHASVGGARAAAQVSVEAALVQPGRYHLLPCTFYRGRARGFVLRVYTPPLKSGVRARANAAGVTLRALNGDGDALRPLAVDLVASPTGRGR